MIIFTFVRTIVPIAVGYDRNDIRGSLSLSLWTPVKLAAWTLVLDLAFYSVCRDGTIRSLTFRSTIARATRSTRCGRSTRCTTARGVSLPSLVQLKSADPTVLLSIFADDVQELIEILLCPLFACLVVPCSWAELFIASS